MSDSRKAHSLDSQIATH